MNQSFIKILRFELRSNYMMWLYNLIIGGGLLTTMFFQGEQHIPDSLIFIFPIFGILTWVFTINCYQESTKNQSMLMYHLIPASRNTKFLSKQLFTLITYPLLLIVTTAIFIGIIRVFINTPELFHKSESNFPASHYLFTIWLFGHAVSTFFAILFKKNKILYSIVVYFCLQFPLSIFFIVFFSGGKNPYTFLSQNIAGQYMGTWIVAGSLLVAAIIYSISYHLFFRRQL